MGSLSLIDTDTSLNAQDIALHDLYNLQAATLNAGLNYDCGSFATGNGCLEGGARYTGVGHNDADGVGGVIVGGYRLSSQVHIGAYLDQNVGSKMNSQVDLKNDTPLVGLYGDWTQSQDGTGFSAHFSTGYAQNDVTITRIALGGGLFAPFSQAGSGDARLYTRGADALFSYGMPVLSHFLVTPYAGLRAENISRAGYTEFVSTAAQPLTYGTLTERQTSALAGLRVAAKVTPRFTLMGMAGIEHDLSHSVGQNSADGQFETVPAGPFTHGVATANFAGTYRTTRAVAAVEGGFDVLPGQQVVVSVGFQQDAFAATNSVTGNVGYQVGF